MTVNFLSIYCTSDQFTLIMRFTHSFFLGVKVRRFQRQKSTRSFGNAVLLANCLVLFSSGATPQSSASSIYVSSEAFLENTRPADGLEPHPGYGFSIVVSTSDVITVGIRAAFANPTSEFDLIAANGNEPMRLSAYQAQCAFRFVQLSGAFDLSVFGRLGFMTVSTNERLVSAGGFGSIKVPARSDRFRTYSVGLTASRELVPHLSAFLSPEIMFFSPAQLSSIGYSIAGGMSIGLF